MGWERRGGEQGGIAGGDSGARERTGHDGECRTGRKDRTWWLMEEHRKEGWDLVGDGGGWLGGMGHSG